MALTLQIGRCIWRAMKWISKTRPEVKLQKAEPTSGEKLMSKKRKQYSAQLKAKVALEAVRGEKTVAEIAAQHEINPPMIYHWKRHLSS
jgi:transposase-like protein